MAQYDEDGKLVKSGGRQLGTPNKSTTRRRVVMNRMIEQLEEAGPDLMQIIITQALGGCDKSQKILLDRMLPIAELDPKGASGGGGVTVNIHPPTPKTEPKETTGVTIHQPTDE